MQTTRAGFVLGTPEEPVLLPRAQAPAGLEPGQSLRVFVYTDAQDGLVATTLTPRATLGEFAFLECVEVNEHGAFMDWGLPKDLFVPFAEQHVRMVQGRSYVVVVCLDRRVKRPMASSKLAPFFDYDLGDLQVGDELSVLVFGHNEAGAQVVVDQRHVGLIYMDATFRDLPVGLELTGYVATLRADNRIDVTLTRPQPASGSGERDPAQETILQALRRAGGFLPLHDRSSPETIVEHLGLSKKLFKRAAGGLYKARRIRIADDGIHLLPPPT